MDLSMILDANGLGADLALAGADLAVEEGMATAVLVSLFSDARAQPDDELPGGDGDRRGWWADVLAGGPEGLPGTLGSRLWLLRRSKLTAETLAAARQYAEEALAWLVDDSVADAVTVRTEAVAHDVMGIEVLIERPKEPPVQYRFEAFWNRQ